MTNLGNKDVFAKNLKKYMQLNGKTRNEVCHAGIRGSTPLGTTKLKPLEFQRFRGFFVHCNFHILGDKHPHFTLFLLKSVAKSVAKFSRQKSEKSDLLYTANQYKKSSTQKQKGLPPFGRSPCCSCINEKEQIMLVTITE